MIYAVLNGDTVTEIRSGDPARRGVASYLQLPEDHQVRPGTTAAWYTAGWHERPVAELVADGLIESPEGMVYDAEKDEWRTATDAELVADGRKTLGEREVLDGDYVREMTPGELDGAGLLTDEERRVMRFEQIQSRLHELDGLAARPLRALLAGTGTEVDQARLQEIETEAVALRTELSALNGEGD